MTQTPPLDRVESSAQFHFSDMHLQPGDRLQIHCPAHPEHARHISRVIGFVEGESLLVSVPSPRGVRVGFMENELVVVQAFSRGSAFAFKCTVLNVCRRPFAYMHLSFPDRIRGSVIRKATRVRIDIEADVTATSGSTVRGRIGNLSATGALLIAPSKSGQVGDSLRLVFKVKLHDVATDIAAEARILKVSGEEGAWQYGVEFCEQSSQERTILRSLVYQQMIENPRSIV
ncbi:MAG: flagellar brake protein [Zoogloeaceae bacterium]|nr:flagellar brake protein [Zoogloeaceae bacterium]